MSLRRVVASGVKWTGASTGATTSLQFIQLAVLARLLSPDDFGLMAMVMVVAGFAQAFADMGISNAIIYRQDVTREQLSSLYWLNIFAGALVFVLVVAVEPLIVAFYSEPRLTDLLHWVALIFLITPVGQQFQVLLQKELRFKPLAIIEVISAVVGAMLAICTALLGQGVFALVWGQLGNAAAKAILLAATGLPQWCPRLRFKSADLRSYVGFGLYQMGERSINYFNSRLDQLIIGALLGAQVLGYYNLAWNLAIQPIARINPIITRVAFPLFAKVQFDNERLKQGFLSALQMLALINFPLLLGLAVVAPILIPLVFGEHWLPAVFLVQILAFVALLRSTGNPVGALLLAKGRADLGFKWNLMLLVTQILGLYLGAHWGGTVGIAVALVLLQVSYFVFGYFILIRSLLGRCLPEYLRGMAPALGMSVATSMCVWLIALIVRQPSAMLLAGQIVVGAVVYFILNWFFQRKQVLEMKSIVCSR